MREDMSKVVIERPRWGHSLPSSKTRLRIHRYDPDKEYDNLPKRVSGSRSKYIRAGETKYFSDLLGPLRRFLRKNVGRPWDKVYSEMKESLDDRKVTGLHFFEHVAWEVETHAFVDGDGELYTWGYRGREPVHGFYLDPRTGLLCWSDNDPWRRARGKSKTSGEDITHIRLSESASYVKLNGIWYFIEFKLYEKEDDHDQANQPLRSILIPEISSASLLLLRKKQLSYKELKTAKLKNDHPLAGSDAQAYAVGQRANL
jgi:hypothetical protein